MKPILVDTGILVAYLRGDRQAASFMETNSERVLLSVAVVTELYAVAGDRDDLGRLRQFLSLFPVIPVDPWIAERAGRHCRNFSLLGRTGLTPAILAATAEAENAELRTLSPDLYPMFDDLRPAWLG